jgi:hypothetical protein
LSVLFVLVVLAHHRRRVVHINVTEHPTGHWTAQQIVDAPSRNGSTCYRASRMTFGEGLDTTMARLRPSGRRPRVDGRGRRRH